jgi:hypothetical protein
VHRSVRLLWLFAFVLGCASSSHEINDVLAAHKTNDRYVDVPKSRTLRDWETGQWVLYKLSTGGRIGYVKHSIVDWTKCGVWIETLVVLGDYEDRTVFKVCFRKVPDIRTDLDVQTDLIEAFMSQRSGRTTAIDLANEHKRKKSLAMALRMLESFPIFASRGAAGTDRHEIVVRAGQFAGVRDVPGRMRIDGKLHAVMISFHPEVPLSGVLEATATDEDDAKVMQIELLDYGLTGAKSELPDFDDYANPVGLD